MDYVPGGTLSDKMKSVGGYVGSALGMYYAAQMLLAIHGLHRIGILHRDIKPDNILFDSRGNIVLTDFGLSKTFDVNVSGGNSWEEARVRGEDHFPLLWPSKNNPHIVVKEGRGTPKYSAPEVFRFEQYSYGVDIWSWAVTFFEAMTGALPWAYDSERETYFRPLVLDLDGANYEVVLGEAERDFFKEAFKPDPFSRWATVHDIKAHRIWGSLNWDALARGALPPPTFDKDKPKRRLGAFLVL
ncbi:kinase-like domain-containing protein, partial [Roridomyces roridus]